MRSVLRSVSTNLEENMSEISINDECIGCESCVEICPEVFTMVADTEKAVVTDPASTAECVDEAIDTCPVQAIARE